MAGRVVPSYVDVTSYWTPWEHRVCYPCYCYNPYAIWLVKVGCFQPHRHLQCEYIRVVIDSNDMVLEPIRPVPAKLAYQQGPFIMCFGTFCRNDACTYAHTTFEVDMWNIKKALARAYWSSVSELSRHSLDSQCPSKVCQACFETEPKAIWLAWLKCTNPKQHTTMSTVTTVVDESRKQLVMVRPCPSGVTQLSQVKICSGNVIVCSASCQYAHSNSELLYWQWQVARSMLKKDRNYKQLNDLYSYPDEQSELINRTLSEKLTRDNYRSKFHKLVYLEEMESSRKIISETRCDDKSATIRLEWSIAESKFNVYLMNLGDTSMDYVSHYHHASVVFTLAGGQQYSAQVLDPDYDKNALLIQIPYTSNIFQRYFPPDCLVCELKVLVHFEIDHRYYYRLHEGIYSVNEDTLAKLMPSNSLKEDCHDFSSVQITQRDRKYSLDKKYQLSALKSMFSCSPDAPYLLLGPFGTGKTYLLAVAVAKLIDSRGKRVLVCTHSNRGADGLYKSLCNRKSVARHVARVVGSQTKNVRLQNASVIYPDENVMRFSVLVTTFGVVIKLIDFVENGNLEFSHILIDEGAQCPEPEVLGALALASKQTKIVIVGDNKQVGPQVHVISEKARKNGLGKSLLERLFSHYKSMEHSSLTKTHTSTLLINYRCHPSILMLASNLFYECALISQSCRTTHPKAPYPLVFACTSVQREEFVTCSSHNEEEAKLLISKMIEFIQTWKDIPTEPIGLLASTKQQVACLRKNWRLMNKGYHFHRFQVEILPTYNIQGEEFSAVFLSTVEPTDVHGAPADRVRSICNEYVFNTVITRAQSLIFVAGNPFVLLHMSSHIKTNCWMEYIRRCIQCQSFELPKSGPSDTFNLPKIVGDICEGVLLGESIQQAKEENVDVDKVDAIVERYLSDLNERREYKIATKLVQNPSGDISWVEQKAADETDDNIVWCKLDCKDFRNAVARPFLPNSTAAEDSIRLKCAKTVAQRKGNFHGGIVRVDIIRKCVLFDEDTEQALANTQFGVSFLCRVDPNNPILFFPLDKRYPKFVNFPVLSVRSKSGVVCFDPKSINSSVKVSNFIPLEVATKMLFLVKFLGWEKWRVYPLGMIVAALPQGHTPYTGELVVRISNGIIQSPCLTEPMSPVTFDTSARTFNGAFTIDPKGSSDHDDALTCRLVRTLDNGRVYEVAVHITDVQKYIPIDSELDKQARERGCATYSSSKHCISFMLPERMIQKELSISEGRMRSALSLIAQYTIDNEGMVNENPNSIAFMESQVQSTLELTYEEAQNLICREVTACNDNLLSSDGKVAHYNNHSYTLRIEEQLEVLWKIAMFVRRKRLGEDAAYALVIEDSHDKECPEAHFLIQEMMIWTNTQVAIKLLETFPDHTPLRVQSRPSEKEVDRLIERHRAAMTTSLSLRSYAIKDQTPVEQVHIVNDVYMKMKESIESGQVRSVLHCVQFEHLHPQMSAAIVSLRQVRKSSTTDYVVSKVDAEQDQYWHDTLQCSRYTHFTSPIRRYIDIVVQRLLYAAIHKRVCPYTKQDLQSICWKVKEAVKRSNKYDRDVRRLYLTSQLREIGQEGITFVQQITEDAEVELTFTDPLFKVLNAREKSIPLKHFNALFIPLTHEIEKVQSAPVPNSKRAEHSRSKGPTPVSSFMWQAKISSFKGNAKSFFSNPLLTLVKHGSNFDQHRHAKISLLSPENGIVSEDSNIVENKLIATVLPYTHTIPAEKWAELQQMTKCEISDPDALLKTITEIYTFDSPTLSCTSFSPEITSPSPMWMYRLQRPIEMSEVLNIQLTASRHEYLLSPELQLVEVGPELNICIQHNRNGSECFADKLRVCASKRRYKSLEEYFKCWEPVLLYEAVVECLSESELLIIKDVTLKWPELEYQCDSLGQASYRLVIPAGERKSGVVMEIPKEFMIMSHEFFSFHVGGLLCIRYNYVDNDRSYGFVLHMVIHDISDPHTQKGESEGTIVYLKFVGKSNFISPKMAELLTSSNDEVSMSCEIQLLPLTLPFRRMYRCLNNLRLEKNVFPLAQRIAKGTAKTTKFNTANLQNIDTMMSPEEASIATSIWPITRREYGSGRKKLNKSQRVAINLACNNDFTLIQGPPGTGKSVTGAHIAYALAKKLHRECASQKPSKLSSGTVEVEDLKPCVMYCGPSNQAVNVVLNYLMQDGVPVKDDLKILRVFSKIIEQKDHPGPKLNDGVFPALSTSEAKCERKHEQYALHKKIRKVDPTIAEMDKEFQQLHKQGKIPSMTMRRRYRKLVHAAEFNVLKSGFDIILCTCNEASSHRIMKGVRPAYCVIDECAMSTEPECMVPIQRAEHVVLIGDHQQLRPVIKNREAEAKGLGTSLFERYAQGDEEQSSLQKPHQLDTQYRMHEALCKFPSDEFYEGNLKTDDSIKNRKNKEARLRFWPQGPNKPFVFVNVEGVERASHTGRKGKAKVGLESKFNEQEAKKIVEIAHVLVSHHKVPRTSLTALTPYSSQKEEIKKRLEEKELSEIPVKTITESQGSESGIILLSTVRSKPRAEISPQDGSSERKNADIGWIRRNLGFVTDPHQICVGLTRCKYGLVIVGNRHLLSYDKTWKRLIDHYKENGCVKNSEQFPTEHSEL